MAHRLVVQVILTGAKVFGRAFTEAYRQAAATTTKASASQATKVADNQITLDEASKILDVDTKGLSRDIVDKKYDYLFNINSKENGGSFYLQSKVYRAAERLKAELQAAEELQKGKMKDN
ncbi:hypothetical protein PACTADRAFT_72055 [Pachysolen tannophilus NRRL Y-2460]|uniref:Mitochondrial import inner membrane translocase subunit TIM16 n=1 Tax=Pachysolen tannophilus NRRL Y-2460 TaxID=669874 RepID=A0A1E4TQA1_PACTA|nr:hypothetical protein PACTADRAFT_72055 [Pachysolen tannophilus NRRL Y-2460]